MIKKKWLIFIVLVIILILQSFYVFQNKVKVVDSNQDGKPDEWEIKNWKGEVIEYKRDKNGDGRIDLWDYYKNEIPIKNVYDFNYDGTPDVWNYYDSNGSLLRIERDSNNDGKVDIISYYIPDRIKPIKIEKDTDFDGKVDNVNELP